MPKMMDLSVAIELPDDLFAAAALTFKLSAPWLALLGEMDSAGIKYRASVDQSETRAKPGRPRKARVAVVQDAA